MKRIALFVMILACVPLLMGLGVSLWPGGGSGGSASAPASGVDSLAQWIENQDWGGSESAYAGIPASEDLDADQYLWALRTGWSAAYQVTCWVRENGTVPSNRNHCILDDVRLDGRVTLTNEPDFRDQWLTREMVPSGYDLMIIALEVQMYSGGTMGDTHECNIAVETVTDPTYDVFDPTGTADVYSDSFTVQGMIGWGDQSNNSALGGIGVDTLNALGESYILPINYRLTDGFLIITARNHTTGTYDCDTLYGALIRVWVQRVAEL